MTHLLAEPEYQLADAERLAIWLARTTGRRCRLVWDVATRKYQVKQTTERISDWVIARARRIRP